MSKATKSPDAGDQSDYGQDDGRQRPARVSRPLESEPRQLTPVLVALCEAAVDCLLEHQERTGRDVVTLAQAIKATDVSMKTAYRHIERLGVPGKPQDVFAEVLLRYLESCVGSVRERFTVVVSETWSPLFGLADMPRGASPETSRARRRMRSMSPAERGLVLVEMVRRGANANVAAYGADRTFLAYLLVSPPSTGGHAASARAFQFAELYQGVAQAFGFKLRPGFEWMHFVRTVSVLAEGLWHDDERVGSEWTLFAETLRSIVSTWFVPSSPTKPYALLPQDMVSGQLSLPAARGVAASQ